MYELYVKPHSNFFFFFFFPSCKNVSHIFCLFSAQRINHTLPCRRIFRSLRRSHTLMSQPAVDVKPVPREELVPQYIEKLKDSELWFRREYEVGSSGGSWVV